MINENTPTIETDRLILRKYTPNDIDAVLEIFMDEQVNTYLPWFPVKTLDKAKEFLEERFLSYYNNLSSYRYAICLKEDNIPIGYVWLSEHENNDLGYGLRSEFWSKGIVTESAKAIVQKIKDAGFLYITATHDLNNPKSGEVMKKIGMQYKYTYVEQWQPKNISVAFRMYQLNFNSKHDKTYMEYWNKYENHYIEQLL